jgi:hypothetical protein
MPILPTPKPVVATESEATRVTSVPAEPANGNPEAEPSTVPATKVKAVKAKKEKKAAKTVNPTADTATLFANFKAAKMVNPFKETVKDHKRFNAVAGADKFEDALPGFKDEKDLKAFIGLGIAWNSRVQKVTAANRPNPDSEWPPPTLARVFFSEERAFSPDG